MSATRVLTRRSGPIRVLAACAVILTAVALAGSALVVSAPIEQPDAIVSLASHEWERLPLTAEFALKYPHAQVLLTLPPVVTRHRCHECANRSDYLVSLGVQRERIEVLPLTESSTRGEARAVNGFVRRRHIRRVLIVTSAYHTRRALRTFRDEVVDTVALGITPAGIDHFAVPPRWWSRPYDRYYVCYEWAALSRDVVRQLMGK